MVDWYDVLSSVTMIEIDPCHEYHLQDIEVLR